MSCSFCPLWTSVLQRPHTDSWCWTCVSPRWADILPDVQRPLLTRPQWSRTRTDAAVHHLLSQVVDLRLKPAVLCRGEQTSQHKNFMTESCSKRQVLCSGGCSRCVQVSHPLVCSGRWWSPSARRSSGQQQLVRGWRYGGPLRSPGDQHSWVC